MVMSHTLQKHFKKPVHCAMQTLARNFFKLLIASLPASSATSPPACDTFAWH